MQRWWRAPEVILNKQQYDNKLDIWSVGCLMAEMLRNGPLFPGCNSFDQISQIIHILGTPTEQELNELCHEGLFYNMLDPLFRYICEEFDHVFRRTCTHSR